MGYLPENKLLLTMSLPMVVSMLVQALYNVVDSFFVARINDDALAAITLAFPAQNFLIAIGAGTGVGVNALLSKSLGEKNKEQADKTAINGVFLAFMSFVFIFLLGLFCSGLFFRLQTKDSTVVEYGKEYLSIICMCSCGLFGQMIFERLLQATGKTFYSMLTQLAGAIINIILDPILIFGYLGFPKMGVSGAAIATVFGQIVAAITGFILVIKKNKEIELKFKGFRPDGRTIAKIYAVGVPSIIMQSIGSVMTFSMNKILYGFSKTAVNVFGVYFKLQSFVFMPIFGLTNGLIPIIAYNYGAMNKKRIMKSFRLGFCYAVGTMIVGFLLFQFLPDKLLGIFNPSEEMLEIGVPALRIISISFIAAGFSIIMISFLQALGHGIFSMVVSIVRQLGVLLPTAYLFSRFGTLKSVWFAFPVAEVVAVVMCTFFVVKVYRKVIANLGQKTE